jgi:DNA excision repair protein ERCC-6
VKIYRYVVDDTIEEKIYHRQIFKKFMADKVLQDPSKQKFFD